MASRESFLYSFVPVEFVPAQAPDVFTSDTSQFSASIHKIGTVVAFSEVEHPEIRQAMLDVLPKIAPFGYPANEQAAGVALLQTLDVSHVIRSAAIGTLADVSSKGSRALVAAAVGLLRDFDSMVRAAAARALLSVARIDDEETLNALAPLLEESSAARSGESVRNRAATLMTSASRSTNMLVKNTFEKHLVNHSPYIRVTAIQGLVDMMENDHHPQVPCNLVASSDFRIVDEINECMS